MQISIKQSVIGWENRNIYSPKALGIGRSLLESGQKNYPENPVNPV